MKNNLEITEVLEHEYDGNDVKVLKGLEAVRLRPGMYIGDTNEKGLHHLIWEVVDNSIDESMAGYCNTINISLEKDGSCIVEDNGRGIPVDIHPTEGISTATVVLTVLHAGAKFDSNTYKVSGGLHGVGISVVNALSSQLNLTIHKNGKVYYQEFRKGIASFDLKEIGTSKKQGTTVQFWADDEIFKETTEFQSSILLRRIKELAFLNPNITINYEDKRNNIVETFHFDGGLAEYVKDLNKTHELKTPILTMKGTEEIPNHPNKAMMEVEVAMVYNSTYSENIISFVNNIKTHEGGTHETGFKSAITKVVSDYLEKNGNSKEKDIKIQGEDTREGLIAIVSVKVPEPQFEGQTKGKLGSAFVLPIVRRIVTAKLEQFFEENPIEAKNILEKSLGAARGREAAKKARDLTRKTTDKNSLATLPGKLADCQTKDSNLAELFLVEGDSAAGSGKMGRNRLYQAILALKGKILNVEKSEASKVLNSEEIKNIITAIGTNVGQDFNLEKLRYKKIIVMTDADVDGSHIQTLILTFFFRYLKPIIENGYLYIAQPPLYRFKKGNFETYLKDDKALNEFLIKEVLNTIEVGDKTSNKRFLLLAVEYKNIMIELEKKYPGVKVLKKIIEEDINEVDNEKIISIIKDLNYNIFSTSIFNDTYNYFIQTEAGAAELSLNNDVLNDSLIISGKNIFKKLNEIENHAFDVKTTIEDLEKVLNNAKKGTYIQRYKGLGEMNPEQLWETTMHPENRNLLQVEISDAEKAEQSFVLFMGSEVEPRKAFILDNAQNVKNLDV